MEVIFQRHKKFTVQLNAAVVSTTARDAAATFSRNKILAPTPNFDKNRFAEWKYGDKYTKTTKIGVCLAWVFNTHTTTTKKEFRVAILQEIIRYYVMLGFHVHMYDRFGAHRDMLYSRDMNSPGRYYAASQNINLATYALFQYHGWTIADKTSMRHEESMGYYSSSMFEDKFLTLAHCRFEMKALGVHNVIVVDPDEFIYCPRKGPTFAKQRMAVRETLIDWAIRFDKDEMQVKMTTPMQYPTGNSTHDFAQNPVSCVEDKIRNNQSLFQCYSSIKHVSRITSLKAMNLGHKCPAGNAHGSCDYNREMCSCQSDHVLNFPTFQPCVAIHLELRSKMPKVRTAVLELYNITH